MIRRRCFTLFELLVALTLLLAIASLATLALGTVAGNWERAERRAADLRERRVLDRTLDNLLGNITPYPWPNAEGREVDQTRGSARVLIVATSHVRGVRFCRLLVRDGAFVAEYCDRPPFTGNRLRSSVLATGIDSVAFRYYAEEHGVFRASPSWRDRPSPPAAVEVALQWRDGRQGIWFRRTAGAGRAEAPAVSPELEDDQ